MPGKIRRPPCRLGQGSPKPRIRQSASAGKFVRPPLARILTVFVRQGVAQLRRQGKRGVNLEQSRQWFSQIGEIDDVILRYGRLATNLAEDDFLVDQLDQGFGLGEASEIGRESS